MVEDSPRQSQIIGQKEVYTVVPLSWHASQIKLKALGVSSWKKHRGASRSHTPCSMPRGPLQLVPPASVTTPFHHPLRLLSPGIIGSPASLPTVRVRRASPHPPLPCKVLSLRCRLPIDLRLEKGSCPLAEALSPISCRIPSQVWLLVAPSLIRSADIVDPLLWAFHPLPRS